MMTKGGGRRFGNNEVFRALVENGPLTYGELGLSDGGVSPNVRKFYDIRMLNPKGNGARSGLPKTRAVIYLGEYHDPEAVIRRWIEVNRVALDHHERFNKKTMTAALSGELKAAWRRINDEFDWLPSGVPEGQGGSTGPETRTCPACGEETEHDIPVHMRVEPCEGVDF